MGIEICKSVNELHPKVRELALALLAECKKQGLNVKITETYRSKERQDYLYAQGRTRSGNIVTNSPGSSMSSYHQWRLAFDVVINDRKDPYNAAKLAKVGKIGEKLGLEWGGSWRGFKDSPHFQYTFGLTIADLRRGKKPPEFKAPIKIDIVYEKAIKKLKEKGLIGNTQDWLPEPNVHNLPFLIKKIGAKLWNLDDYEKTIKKLVEEKIIQTQSQNFWLKHTYNTNHVKAIVKKIANILFS